MNRNALIALALFVLGGLCTGCSGAGNPIVAGQDVSLQTSGTVDSNRVLWGMWQCSVDPASGRIEVVPLRGAMFTANVNNLLEGKPGNLLIQNMDTTNFFTEGRLDCTVMLKHPFPGLDMYNGFDVWGVFMHNGSATLKYDDLVYSDGSGPDEGMLLNPDGYTRWFNHSEFDGNGSPILEYWPGKLSNLPAPTATLNAYKVFADGLGVEDDYYEWVTTSGNADDRGVFSAGIANSRRYQLKFPIIGGVPEASFQYAVIATWEPGDPTLTGNPTTYDPGDFPPNANCEEPFCLHVTTDDSDLYNDGAGSAGGSFKANVEVFDWQGGIAAGNGVPNEVNRMVVEGDFVPGGTYEFSQAELATVAIPATENSSVFQVEIADCQPQASGVADFWVIVEAAGANGETYGQGFPTKYPDAPRASFTPGTVDVSDIAPWPDVIYVDDSNTTGVEDGTHTHPYNTIQEGIDNNPDLKEVWVDDSGAIYAENVQMKDNTILKSTNWDDSDGTGRTKIQGPSGTAIHTLEFNNVSGATLQGFEIMPFNFIASFSAMDILLVTNGSGNTIKDCLFKGAMPDSATIYVLNVRGVTATGSSDLTVQNCRFDGLDRGANMRSMSSWNIVRATNCPGMDIVNNIFTNIRSTADTWGKSGYITYMDTCSDLVLKNNLIHDIKPIATGNSNLHEGFRLTNCTNPTLVNNTVDSFDVTQGFMIQQVFAYRIENCTGVTFKNNIATRIYCNGFPPPLARGLLAVNSTFTVYYCDMWDIGPGGNGQNYYWSGGVLTIDPSCISADPQYIDADNEDFDLQSGSPAQQGDPTIVDWDDTGTPSGDPDNTDTNKRSRMGSCGGPDGQYIGLLTP